VLLSSAPKARQDARPVDLRPGLPCFSEALEFVAEILEVVLADGRSEDFLDHRQEVRQRADRAQRWSADRPPFDGSKYSAE